MQCHPGSRPASSFFFVLFDTTDDIADAIVIIIGLEERTIIVIVGIVIVAEFRVGILKADQCIILVINLIAVGGRRSFFGNRHRRRRDYRRQFFLFRLGQLVDGFAIRTNDGIAVQVIELDATFFVLARPLCATRCFVGHTALKFLGIRRPLPCGIPDVKTYSQSRRPSGFAKARATSIQTFETQHAARHPFWRKLRILMQHTKEAPAHPTMKPMRAHAGRGFTGRRAVPGDKSISHRALMFGGLAIGTVNIAGLLEAEDVLNTAAAMRALGAEVDRLDNGVWRVRGRGVGGLRQPAAALDFGNAGTGTRLMMGLIAGHDMTVEMTGDASLSRRPMGRVLAPLRQMGLQVEDDRETLPLKIRGTPDLVPIDYVLPVPSAQVKSAVLIAGLMARGETSVLERESTRDHTERMLRYLGAQITTAPRDFDAATLTAITVAGDAELIGRDIQVPGDPSSAAFLVAAALIVPESDVTIEGVLINETRNGLYTTLREMGAEISFENEREQGGEMVADIRAQTSSLRGVDVPAGRAPSMIDEYPVLAVVAAYAAGETRMNGLAELKVKESDRLAATAAGLAANGVEARIEGDDLIVSGGRDVAGGGLVATHLDHRIAMAFLTLGLAAKKPVTVDDANIIATSFREFPDLMRGLGARLEWL